MTLHFKRGLPIPNSSLWTLVWANRQSSTFNYVEDPFQRTLCVYSRDPPRKNYNAWFTTVPLKGLSDQLWIIYPHVYVFVSLVFYFVASLQKWLAQFLRIRNNGENIWIKHFSSQKNNVIFQLLIRLKFREYRSKSGIATLEWRVPWN